MLDVGDRIGHYEVLRALDRGGMGCVFLVRHLTLDAQYAMKVLKPEVADNDEYVARFLREGRLASKIRHPNLIAVYDAGCDVATGLNYLVMDYVSGGTLSELLKREGALPVPRALSIVRQVTLALVAAAEHGMVHRDIKPANIMFDADGSVKLADLGIAKGGEEMTAVTRSEAVFGTPAYMSPEQARDSRSVDCRTDIYSLGVVLWQMLSGERPYADLTALAIVVSVLKPEPLPDIRQKAPSVPKSVAKLLRDMCQKNRDKRIPSAADLLERIDAIAGGAGVEGATMQTVAMGADVPAKTPAAPTASPPSLWRWAVVAAGAVLAIVLWLVVADGGRSPQPSETPELPSKATGMSPPAADVPAPADSIPDAEREARRQAEEKAAVEARRLVEERERAEAEAKRLADEKARIEAERKRLDEERRLLEKKRQDEERRLADEKRAAAERAAAERKRMDEEARAAALAMTGRSERKLAAETPKVAAASRPAAVQPVRPTVAQLALKAFEAGNWSLGYQYALQDTSGNPEVLLWLGKCFDPSVEMPGFERHKKDADLARKYYRQAAEKGNEAAARAVRRL